MKILVTGASGFIGKSLIEQLIALDIETLAILRDPQKKADCEFLCIPEFTDSDTLQQAMCDIDVVIHLAARVHVMYEAKNNIDVLAEFLKVNVHDTTSLAIAAAKADVKRFVYVSSVKVNGESTKLKPFTENDPVLPCDAYAISKWQAELALRQIELETGMQVVVMRPPLVYGPGVKANFLNLIKLVDRGIPLPFAAIKNKRSLIYIGNVVDALIQCALHPKAAGNTYLVSDGHNASTPELISCIADCLHKSSNLLSISPRLIMIAAMLAGKSSAVKKLTESLVVDNSKICNELGWLPPFTFKQGLATTIAWYKESH